MHCQLEYLAGCLPGCIRHALDELPPTLDATYERTLQEIDGRNWEFVRRLLHCVAVVSRPLRVEELAEFLAFDFNAGQIPTYHEDWRLEDPVEAVLSTCSTLLSLVNARDFVNPLDFGNPLDFDNPRLPSSTIFTLLGQGVLDLYPLFRKAQHDF